MLVGINSKEPLFSVLIASYNNAEYICEAINSVLTQTYTNWEIIIIDDASTDNSVSIIKNFCSNNRKIRVSVNAKNEGCGYTKSKCAELAIGEICGYLDPDDALDENALTVMVKYHQENPQASFIFSNHYNCDNELENPRPIKKNSSFLVANSYLDSGESILAHFGSFKTQSYHLTKGIDCYLKRAVDQDLFYKMEEVGSVLHINEFLYFYRLHKSGISTFSNSYKAYAWHLYVIMETCKRRSISFEQVVAKNIQTTFIKMLKGRIDYKLGRLIIYPVVKIREALRRQNLL